MPLSVVAPPQARHGGEPFAEGGVASPNQRVVERTVEVDPDVQVRCGTARRSGRKGKVAGAASCSRSRPQAMLYAAHVHCLRRAWARFGGPMRLSLGCALHPVCKPCNADVSLAQLLWVPARSHR